MDSKKRIQQLCRFIEGKDVPIIYWTRIGVVNELRGLLEKAENDLGELKDPDSGDFEEILWQFFATSNLHARVITEIAGSNMQPTELEIVQTAREMVLANGARRKKLFSRLRTYAESWRKQFPSVESLRLTKQRMMKEEERKHEELKRFSRVVRLFILILGVSVILLLGGIFVSEYVRSLKRKNAIVPTPIVQVETQEVYITQLPDPTQPPLVSTPSSQYTSLRLDQMFPETPYGLDPQYVIDDTDAEFGGSAVSNWMEGESGIGGMHHYINDVKEGQDAYAMWTFDQGLPDSGRYELFILDPFSLGACADPLTYEVFVSDHSVEPFYGSRTIAQKFQREQTDDEWASLGMYEFAEGDVLSVQLNIPEVTPSTECYFSADAVLLARHPDLDPLVIEPLQRGDVADKTVLFPVDDQDALVSPSDILWESATQAMGNWEGVRFYTIAEDTTILPSVEYVIPRAIVSGSYDLWIWMPDNASAPVDFSISITNTDGTQLPQSAYSYTLDTVDPVEESFQGKPLRLAAFENDKPVFVRVTASGVRGSTGEFAVDAVYITLWGQNPEVDQTPED